LEKESKSSKDLNLFIKSSSSSMLDFFPSFGVIDTKSLVATGILGVEISFS